MCLLAWQRRHYRCRRCSPLCCALKGILNIIYEYNSVCKCIFYLKINAQKLRLKSTGGFIFPFGRDERIQSFTTFPLGKPSRSNSLLNEAASSWKKVGLLMTDTYVAVTPQKQRLALYYRLQALNWSYKCQHEEGGGERVAVYCPVLERPLNCPSDPQCVCMHV